MNNDILGANLSALSIHNPALHRLVCDTGNEGLYEGVAVAKTGVSVPIFSGGIACHSLYDPEQEGRRLLSDTEDGSFVVFAGIGGGYHIRAFLSLHPSNRCVVIERDSASLRRLCELVRLDDLIRDERVAFFTLDSPDSLADTLPKLWFPAIQESLRVMPLRPWKDACPDAMNAVEAGISRAIEDISSDFSVQSHFGRLWLRNICLNLVAAERTPCLAPEVNLGTIAIVAAAGPSLEIGISRIKQSRGAYTVFSTDTAYGTLLDLGVIPDFYLSIDGQQVSSAHLMGSLHPRTRVIVDVCANPEAARAALSAGSSPVFAAGGHPLARYASAYSVLPYLDTSSGTVTVAAKDAARALGFSEVRTIGADFAYTGGKPYARGTYLAKAYDSRSNRLLPSEGMYSALMFRTPVSVRFDTEGITYGTATLDRYRAASSAVTVSNRWSPSCFSSFPATRFFRDFAEDIRALSVPSFPRQRALMALMPFLAWSKTSQRAAGKKTDESIELALELIAGYTGLL